jgi:hypothetical protein
MTIQDEFEHWLRTALRPLSGQLATVTRDELTAHYEDALDGYVLDGLPLREAHRAALNDLGDPRSVQRGLYEAHRARRDYRRAALLSIAPSLMLAVIYAPLMLMVSPDLFGADVYAVFACTVLTALCGFSVYCTDRVLRTFATLTGAAALFHTPIRVIRLVLLALMIPCALSVYASLIAPVVTHPLIYIINTPVIFFKHGEWITPITHADMLLTLAIAAGVVVLGICWLVMAWRLERIEHHTLYGLALPLRVGAGVIGLGLVYSGVGLLAANMLLVHLAGVLLTIAAVLTFAAFTLLFFRAADTLDGPPTLVA